MVPAQSSSQFQPERRDGKIIGRGTADMKGGLVFHALRRRRRPRPGPAGSMRPRLGTRRGKGSAARSTARACSPRPLAPAGWSPPTGAISMARSRHSRTPSGTTIASPSRSSAAAPGRPRHRIQGGAGQRRKARATLDNALKLFERIDARIWADRARAELGRLGGRAPGGDELTATERRVWRSSSPRVGRTRRWPRRYS